MLAFKLLYISYNKKQEYQTEKTISEGVRKAESLCKGFIFHHIGFNEEYVDIRKHAEIHIDQWVIIERLSYFSF